MSCSQILDIKASGKPKSYVIYTFISKRRLRESAFAVLRKRIVMAEKLMSSRGVSRPVVMVSLAII
jgi:hypothetical protein